MISAIIPTLNEAQTIKSLIADLKACRAITQIVVVDGGSTDQTTALARSVGAQVIAAGRGKAIQMNMGAAAATNDCLLFLHADSRVSKASLQSMLQALKHFQAGSFYVEFDNAKWLYKLYSRFSRCNNALFTYGDQGLFVKKQLFEAVGGFAPIPIMEDLEMVEKLKRKVKFVKLKAPIITSARRFEKVGIFKQQVINILLVILYKCGVSPKVLKKYYPY